MALLDESGLKYLWSQLKNKFAAASHNHDEVYAKLRATNTYNGEQKFTNSLFCPNVRDNANDVGTAYTLQEVLNCINAGYTVTASGGAYVYVFEKPTCDITVYWYARQIKTAMTC